MWFPLCLKTGNAAILRGERDPAHQCRHGERIQRALEEWAAGRDGPGAIENPDRALVGEMLKMDKYIDMLIPRGAGLHKLCREQSTIPVITGGIGVCHIYIDDSAGHS